MKAPQHSLKHFQRLSNHCVSDEIKQVNTSFENESLHQQNLCVLEFIGILGNFIL